MPTVQLIFKLCEKGRTDEKPCGYFYFRKDGVMTRVDVPILSIVAVAYLVGHLKNFGSAENDMIEDVRRSGLPVRAEGDIKTVTKHVALSLANQLKTRGKSS